MIVAVSPPIRKAAGVNKYGVTLQSCPAVIDTYTPTVTNQQVFATDPGVIADILANKISISIGSSSLNAQGAVEVLRALSSVYLTGATDGADIGNVLDALKVTMRDSSGNEIGSASNPLKTTTTITSMPEVEIKNDSGNPIPITATSLILSLQNK
jgi:hypothetical protein